MVACIVLMAVAVGFAAYTLGHDAGRAQGVREARLPHRPHPLKVQGREPDGVIIKKKQDNMEATADVDLEDVLGRYSTREVLDNYSTGEIVDYLTDHGGLYPIDEVLDNYSTDDIVGYLEANGASKEVSDFCEKDMILRLFRRRTCGFPDKEAVKEVILGIIDDLW